MLVEADITIQGSKSAVWDVITNIEHAPEFISGIKKVEMLERPARGLVGLKWRETRILFGKPAAVDLWITEAVDNEYYTVNAKDSGFLFVTTMRLSQSNGGVVLTSSHLTQPQGFVATLKATPMFLFKGVIKKAIVQDLNDIKAAVEKK